MFSPGRGPEMAIDAYYRFEKVSGTKSKYILKAHAGVYEYLHRRSKRNGELVLYCTAPVYIHSDSRRLPAQALSGPGSAHYSRVSMPDPRLDLGFGDMAGTEDGLLMSFQTAPHDMIEIWVFAHRAARVSLLYNMACDGDPDLLAEMEALKGQAVAPAEMAN
jgi:hypothetical protein